MTIKSLFPDFTALLILLIALIIVLSKHPTIQAYTIPGLLESRLQQVVNLLTNGTNPEKYWKIRDSLGVAWHMPNYSTPLLEGNQVILDQVYFHSPIANGNDRITTKPITNASSSSQIYQQQFTSKEAIQVNGYFIADENQSSLLWISQLEVK